MNTENRLAKNLRQFIFYLSRVLGCIVRRVELVVERALEFLARALLWPERFEYVPGAGEAPDMCGFLILQH